MTRRVILLGALLGALGFKVGAQGPPELRRSLAAIRRIDSLLPSLRRVHVPYADTALARGVDNYAYIRDTEPLAIVEQWCNPAYCAVEKFYFEWGVLIAASRYRDSVRSGGIRRLIPGTRTFAFFIEGALKYHLPLSGRLETAPFSAETLEDAADLREEGMAYRRMVLRIPRDDEFSDVRCGSDIAAAMRGRKPARGRLVEIELAHQDIRLRQTGGSIVNDSLFLNGWSRCGQDYHVLHTTVVEDVLRLPPHSDLSSHRASKDRVYRRSNCHKRSGKELLRDRLFSGW